jgi:hypothetical protein
MITFDENNRQIVSQNEITYTQSQYHEQVDHKFGVTFLGQVMHKTYFYSDDSYSKTLYDYIPYTPSNEKDVYVKTEFAKYKPICTSIFKSPLFKEGDGVFVPQVNKSAKITGIERSIEDGSYRIYVDVEIDLIEDTDTEKSMEKALEEREYYYNVEKQKKKDEEQKAAHDKEVMEHVKIRDKWNKQHTFITKLFKSNPYDFDELVREYDSKIEKEQLEQKLKEQKKAKDDMYSSFERY